MMGGVRSKLDALGMLKGSEDDAGALDASGMPKASVFRGQW